ncbi:MAG: hypothetical protein GY898_30900 [Proteobacteria bacterium]|nr:hypothetical protein [Pseudomonadota bacterium]
MSRPPWTPKPEGLRRHPQLAALAALDHQLRLVIGVLAAVHEGQVDTLPELHQARGIAHVARTLQSQIDAYRRLVAAPPKAAELTKRRSPGRT